MIQLRTKKYELKLDFFLETLLSFHTKRELHSFLVAILTPAEFEQLPIRLEIVRQLKKGVPQREIAEELGVGIATITRGAREIKQNKFNMIS